MGKLFYSKVVLSFLGLLIILCCSCGTKESGTGEVVDTTSKLIADETKQLESKQPEVKSPEGKQPAAEKPEPTSKEQEEKKPEEPPVVEAVTEPSNIVAKIGDYVITRKELEESLMTKLQPDEYRGPSEQAEPLDAKTVLMEMIAEKAMMIEARKLNLTERETIRTPIKYSKEGKLLGMLLGGYVQGKVKVTESEIEEKIKADPNLSRDHAKAMLERTQANKLIDEYYSELYKKLNVQKVSDNFPRAAEIHQRLLLHPKEPSKMAFIRETQVENELTPEEKRIVLAKFDGGEVTLKDWFDTLCEFAPPSRPKDLHTPAGVERLLDWALSKAVFVSEAELLGLDKDRNLLEQLKEEEDRRLLYEMVNELVKDIKGPTNEEEIIAYFNKNKEAFGIEKQLKIDQIWCQDRNTAEKVKAELDNGKDFESVRQEYSLLKKGNPFHTSPSVEGMFFDDLWKGEPNEIVGPVKGFYRDGFKWRVVKILEKKPGQMREYSSDMKEHIKWRIVSEQRNAALAKYRQELLKKYPYEIYADRIKDIDPLNIP